MEAFLFGSVPLRAVLPDGDIDISVFTTAAPGGAADGGGGTAGVGSVHGRPPGELRDTWASQLLRALEREASRPDAPFKIRDVQIIQAEVCAATGCPFGGRFMLLLHVRLLRGFMLHFLTCCYSCMR